MSEEEIEKQLKKSRRQRKDERYEYINSHFNQTNYAMSLEKHALKLHSQNAQLKSVLKEIREFMEVEEEAGTLWTVRSTNVILEIIDKGIGEDK